MSKSNYLNPPVPRPVLALAAIASMWFVAWTVQACLQYEHTQRVDPDDVSTWAPLPPAP